MWKLIQKIIKPPNAHVIEIDEKIMLNAYKRGLLGKKPYEIKYINNKDPDKKPVYDIQPDCVFIESVVMFLKKHKLLKKINLYLCTNDNGFYTTIEKIELDQNVRKDLDVKDFYLNLSSFLIKFLKLRKKGKEDAKRTTVKTLDAYPLVPADTTSEQGSDLSVKLVPGDAKAVEEGALSFKVAKGDKNI